nr:hypothetical protein [Vibrio sp.]
MTEQYVLKYDAHFSLTVIAHLLSLFIHFF